MVAQEVEYVANHLRHRLCPALRYNPPDLSRQRPVITIVEVYV